MIESVLADTGTTGTNMAIATMSAVHGGSATTAAVTAAAAAIGAPVLAETVWRECRKFRIRKAVPSIPSPLTAKTANLLTALRGGGGGEGSTTAIVKKAPDGRKVTDSDGKILLAARSKSVAFMALAMACHYLGEWIIHSFASIVCYVLKFHAFSHVSFLSAFFGISYRAKIGYSLARPVTVALFTSKATGYPDSPGAFPFAMAFVSPISLLFLLGYGSILEKRGPRGALKRTTLYCSSAILVSSAAVEVAQRTSAVFLKTSIPVVKLISGPLFVFRESYVQLLTRCVKNLRNNRFDLSCLK